MELPLWFLILCLGIIITGITIEIILHFEGK